MKILNTQQIRDCDAYTIKNEPILSIDLMERASQQLLNWIINHYSANEHFEIFAGSGNNGGDAFALARLLYNSGYENIKVFVLNIGKKLSLDCEKNLERLKVIDKIEIQFVNSGDEYPVISDEGIVIDGILGSGLTREVTNYWGGFINHINSFSSEVISIDLPSGVFAENNTVNSGSKIKANTTLMFQFPKLSCLFVDNYTNFGKWFVLDIGLHPDFINNVKTLLVFTEIDDIKTIIKQRNIFDHKGTYGHAFLVAGSYGKIGAAVLSATATLRTGVGLLTVHVPEKGLEIMQTAVPEAMIHIDESGIKYGKTGILDSFEAVGIGPGIGMKPSMQDALKRLIGNCKKPMVIDADALNIISENKEWLQLLPKDTILTPHPGEFDRLTKKHKTSYERYESQIQFSKKYNIIVVLKGAYTSISDASGNVCFNSTGNPGMATAGSGDVLTGIILSLLAQGYKPIDASVFGVFLHGLAGDSAAKKRGQESLIASDIIKYLSFAFNKILS